MKIEPALTREQAQAAGYIGYAMHMTHLPCPKLENPRVYCATCQGPLAQLARGKHVASS